MAILSAARPDLIGPEDCHGLAGLSSWRQDTSAAWNRQISADRQYFPGPVHAVFLSLPWL